MGLQPRRPLGLRAEQVFLGDHFEDGAHVLGHAAVNEDERVLQGAARILGDLVAVEHLVGGHEAAAADGLFRIALAGERAADQFDAGPDAAGVLPAAARAAEPFAEQGAGEDDAALVFLKPAGERARLAGGAHAHADQGREQVGGNREPRALRDVVHVADDFQPAAGADDTLQQVGEALSRALDAGRDDAAGDHGGLEQAEVVFGEIEDLVEDGNFRGATEVHTGEAQHRLVDHPQAGLDRRRRIIVAAMDGEVHRDVEHLRALGVVHAEEENIAPAAVSEVHADRRALAQHRIEAAGRIGGGEFPADAQRLVVRVAHAEHPLVSGHAAHAAAHLVGQRLEGEFLIGRGQRAGNPVAGAMLALVSQEHVDGLLEAACEQVFVALEGNRPGWRVSQKPGQVEALDGMQEQQGPHALIEVVALAAETIERIRLGEQFVEREFCAGGIERLVADVLVRRDDEIGEGNHARAQAWDWASRSTRRESTSSRSLPARPRASWVASRP